MKKLRLDQHLTLEELANTLNKKYPNTVNFNKGKLSKWENGKEEPKLSSIRILADFYNIRIDDFYADNPKFSSIEIIYNQLEPPRQQKVYNFAENQLEEQEKENKQKNNSITSLEQFRKKKEEDIIYGTTKWYGAVSAGTGEFLTDETCEEIELPIEQIPDEADFCLSVNGDSMEPIFHDDDYVFIKRQLEIYSGSIGVVIVNGESFLKRIWFENNFVRLESFNKKYKDIIITENDEFRIVGKVVM
ncbi:TPA: helix-turn-helix transcriptional regulator [Enterococcus faecalis]|nr:helix-turn-helix transcriptional regulator [Enterococcus faecalis]